MRSGSPCLPLTRACSVLDRCPCVLQRRRPGRRSVVQRWAALETEFSTTTIHHENQTVRIRFSWKTEHVRQAPPLRGQQWISSHYDRDWDRDWDWDWDWDWNVPISLHRRRIDGYASAERDSESMASEAAASDRQGMLGASSWRKPSGDILPVAASYLHAGNHFRKLGSPVRIDAAQGFQGEVAAIMNAEAERARSFAAVHGEDLRTRPPRLFHAASRDDGVPSAIGEDGARSSWRRSRPSPNG